MNLTAARMAVLHGFVGMLGLVLSLSESQASLGAEKTFLLREQLGQKWQRQLVQLEFETPRGDCNRQSLRLTEDGQAVAFQLVDARTWPNEPAMVRSGKIAAVVDLEPLQSRQLVLHYGPEPLPQQQPPLETDLTIETAPDAVELGTSNFGICLPLGELTFDPPAKAAAVPGPVKVMRLADGTWFGGSRLFGPAKVRRFSAALTEAGPVLGKVSLRYEYADGNVLQLSAELSAGDRAVYWDMQVADDVPDSGWQLVLSEGLPSLVFPVQMEHFCQRPCFLDRGAEVGDWATLPLAEHRPGLVTQLTPWADWWDDYTQTAVRLLVPGTETELDLVSRDPGAWVEPEPMGNWASSAKRKHKMMPLEKTAEGEVLLRVNLAAGEAGGVRRWRVGQYPARPPAPQPSEGLSPNHEVWGRFAQRRWCTRRLNEVRQLVLDWPELAGPSHPRLFVTAADVARRRAQGNVPQQILAAAEHFSRMSARRSPHGSTSQRLAAWLLTGDRQLAEDMELAECLRLHLGLLGDFDLMRHAVLVASLYDALIDSELITEEERPLLQAQMAYLAYQMVDPITWSMERGYTSGNPNMSVSYVLSLGTLAAALPEHPMAKQWAARAINRMEKWLSEDLGPKGEWMESSHYSHVSGLMMLSFVAAAKNAKLHDFSTDPRLKRLMLYIVKQYTPPDPTRSNYRVHPPQGRRHAGARTALPGIMARLTTDSDPVYSAAMQWIWKGGGFSYEVYDDRLPGVEHVFLDESLPAKQPDWKSELFPRVGPVLRHGFGTPHEHYLSALLNGDVLFARPSETGTIIKWFAMGRPIGGLFTGGEEERQELLTSRVMPARSMRSADEWLEPTGYDGSSQIAGFAALPRQDYFDARFKIEKPWQRSWWTMFDDMPAWPSVELPGEPPIDWRRQALYVKARNPARPSYLVLRDTVRGGQPTMWQFWTLSQKIGTPEEAAERATFLADAPGEKPAAARQLHGDRFTAVSQHDVDLEYYIAAPRGTPRYTLRWGTDHYRFPIDGYSEYQDLLNLRLAGDGHYLVVLYPRWQTEPAPQFSTHADGTVVKVESTDGTDYVLLADGSEPVEAAVDQVRFEASAASVQQRRTPQGQEQVLTLSGPGEVACGAARLKSDGPASLCFGPEQTTVLSLPADHKGRQVHLSLPRYEEIAVEQPVTIQPAGKGWLLQVPEGTVHVELQPR